MKEIKIKRIKIENWKGQTHSVDFNENITTICGANGIGKTSIFKAFSWLLTGYTDSMHGKNHELFDNRFELTQHTPEAVVTATISINGEDVEIKRSAKAKFVRPKGCNEYVKDSSDTYKYFIDNIDYSLRDFNAWIENNICDTELLKFCVSGEFFTTLAEDDKTKARNVLRSLIGVVENKDVCGDYSVIYDDMYKYSDDEMLSKYKNLIKPFEKRATEIPAIILEKRKYVLRDAEKELEDALKELDCVKNEIELIDKKIVGNIDAIKPQIDKRDMELKELSELKKKLSEMEFAFNNNEKSKKYELCSKISEIELKNKRIAIENANLKKEFDNIEKEIQNKKQVVEECTLIREQLVSERNEIKKCVFNEEDAVCDLCGQKLPIDKIEKAREEFDKNKQLKLSHIIAEGKRNTEILESAKNRIIELENEYKKGFEEKPMEDTSELLKEYEKEPKKFEETQEYFELKNEIDNFKISTIDSADNDELIGMKNELSKKRDELNNKVGMLHFSIEKCASINEEVEELKKELVSCGNELANIEQKIIAVKRLEQEKAEILAERVNKHLKNSYIQMFEYQKNGETTPSCSICSKDGVKYATLNNSARLLTIIEIQRMFSELLNVKLPVFCDECSIYDTKHLPQNNGQIIYIYCSDDNKLVVK